MTSDELSAKMKTTAGCRFIAHKRLLALDAAWTRLTALTSAYVIVLTALPYFLSLPTHVADHINLATLALAVIVLIASLVQYASNNAATGEQFHRSALEINEIRRELDTANPNSNVNALQTAFEKYNVILQKYSINQDDIDYLRYQYERPDDYPWIDAEKQSEIARLVFWSKYWSVIVMATITILWLALIFVYAIPSQIIGSPA
jgi:hypothetical protein